MGHQNSIFGPISPVPAPITPDQYLQGILQRERVGNTSLIPMGILSPAAIVQSQLSPMITCWANGRLLSIHPSGSFMKGTANLSGTDVDLFISLSEDTIETLKEIYDKLFNYVKANGYAPTRQNVSINIRVNGYSVDLVPGKRQGSSGNDHSLYRQKADTWKKTNVITHINKIANSGRTDVIRIIKLWRDQKKLDFPSFYLELTVLDALPWQPFETLSGNVLRVFQYLRDRFIQARVVDPANSNNIISDDLTSLDKAKVRVAAIRALNSTWGDVVK